MAVHNNFKQRLSNGECLIGTFTKTPSMMMAEVIGQTDLDVVCIDAEHSPFDRGDIDQNIFAYRAANKPSLVRVPEGSPSQLLNVLDCGATGVVVPHVDSADKARAIAKACKFGDKGRGYAGSTRAAAYTGRTISENLKINQRDNVVIAQIEDLSALDVIDDIAAVEGIDCLFIGMMDLTVALGQTSPRAPEVVAAGIKICEAARRHNRCLGIFVPSVDDIAMWKNEGVTLFLMSSDHGFVKQGANALATSARAQF